MTQATDDDSRNARRNRATYELHDLAGQRTSVLFVARHNEFASDFLHGASIFPAVQNFHLTARAQGTWDPERADIVHGIGARPGSKG